MKKQLFILTLAFSVIVTTNSMTKAENSFTKELKGIGSQVSKDTKAAVKDIKDSAKKDAENRATKAKKSKIDKITEIKNAKLKVINEKIQAKKDAIASVKNSDMLESEKTARLAILNRELKYLETKKANIEKTYNNQLNALK